MKKSSLVIIMLLCSGFLLSSCSRLSDITITKRHYRSGYYVDLGGSHKQNKTKHQTSATVTTEAKSAELTSTAPVTATVAPSVSDELEDNSAVAPEKAISVISPVLVSGTTKEKKQAHKKVSDNVYASSKNDLSAITTEIQEALIKNSIAVNASKENNIISSSAASSADSLPMWLMVVFAIILPPLAIGLKFGIIDKFWISCLLTLIFWIPGVIYAIYWITK